METAIKRRGRPPVETPKTSTSFRLSTTARQLLATLTEDSGLSQASVIEVALRDMAKARGLKVPREGAA